MLFIRKIIWPSWCAMFTFSGLIAMHLVERLANLPPCPLCYLQRQIYWAITAVGIICTIFRKTKNDYLLNAILTGILSILFIGSFIAATYHAGVEWKWWAGPEECTAGFNTSAILDMDLDLSSKGNFVNCSEAPWRVMGLSFAGWNAIASLTFAIMSVKITLSQIRQLIQPPLTGKRS